MLCQNYVVKEKYGKYGKTRRLIVPGPGDALLDSPYWKRKSKNFIGNATKCFGKLRIELQLDYGCGCGCCDDPSLDILYICELCGHYGGAPDGAPMYLDDINVLLNRVMKTDPLDPEKWVLEKWKNALKGMEDNATDINLSTKTL